METTKVKLRLRKCSAHIHPLQWYEQAYGLPGGTISQYYRRGWPLDEPEKLLEKILNTVHGPKSDISVLQALVDGKNERKKHFTRNAGGANGRTTKAKAAPKPPERTKAALQLVDEEDDAPEDSTKEQEPDLEKLQPGVAEELKRMQRECTIAYRDYKRATRPLDKLALHKVWVALVKSMRELAKDAPTAEREAKTVVEVVDVDSVWTRTFQEVRTIMENLPRRISTNKIFAPMRDHGLDLVDVEAVVRAESDKVVELLQIGSWLEKKVVPR